MLELLNLFVSAPRWNPQAMVRAKQAFTTHFRAMPKSLERATADRQLSAMFGSDRYVHTVLIHVPVLALTKCVAVLALTSGVVHGQNARCCFLHRFFLCLEGQSFKF